MYVKKVTEATSCKISFDTLPTEASGLLFHKANEENYIILSRTGKFRMNDDVFEIGEESIKRVSTRCDRNLKCTSAEPMTYIGIQAKNENLEGYTMTATEITGHENLL